jgi:hypothetical protein
VRGGQDDVRRDEGAGAQEDAFGRADVDGHGGRPGARGRRDAAVDLHGLGGRQREGVGTEHDRGCDDPGDQHGRQHIASAAGRRIVRWRRRHPHGACGEQRGAVGEASRRVRLSRGRARGRARAQPCRPAHTVATHEATNHWMQAAVLDSFAVIPYRSPSPRAVSDSLLDPPGDPGPSEPCAVQGHTSGPGPGLPPRFELDHDFTDALAHISRIRKRKKLRRDAVYQRIRPQLERVLRGFEWDLEPTLGTPLTTRRPGCVRAVAWNVERGKRYEGLSTLLRTDPELRDADILMLTEVDIGMGRSNNRNVPREIAAELGMGYVFANYHIVLAEGDRGERGHGIPNTKALHGCALLTRFPVLRFEAVELYERRDKFHATEKRMGNKRTLLCELLLPDGPLTVALVHLDPFAGPRNRAASSARSSTACAASAASACCSAAT